MLSGPSSTAANGRFPIVTARRWTFRALAIALLIWSGVRGRRAGKRCGAMARAATGVRAASADIFTLKGWKSS